MDRQHAMKPACPAPGNKHNGGSRLRPDVPGMEAMRCRAHEAGLTGVMLYLFPCVHGLFPRLESCLHEARSWIILGSSPSI